MSVLQELKEKAKGLKILYVEDEEELRNSTQQFLKKFFDMVDTAEDGQEGLARFTSGNYDIILSDINMPKMNGLDFMREVRRLNSLVQTIILSAHDDKSFLLNAIEIGIDHYLLKPADSKVVGAALLKCIHTIRLREELETQRQMMLQQSRAASQEELLMYIAHHWRQPLNILGLSIQNLAFDFEEGIIDTAYLDRLIDNDMKVIIDLSDSIEAFRSFYTPNYDENFYIVQTTKEVIRLLYNAFEDEKIAISYSLCGTVTSHVEHPLPEPCANDVTVHGNSNDFKQVLLALISNAREAIIRKRKHQNAQAGKIKINLEIKEDHYLFTIEDDGGGMDEATLKQAFLPFFTTEEIAVKKGLGLYIANMLVTKKLEGTLTLENTAEGIRSVISLPKEG